MEKVSQFAYLGASVSAGGECEAAVIMRIILGLVEFKECGKLSYQKRFLVTLKGTVFYMGEGYCDWSWTRLEL